MEFNIGDRVINHHFGAGVIVERIFQLGYPMFIVVFDAPHPYPDNFVNENLPANRCGRLYKESLEKEV